MLKGTVIAQKLCIFTISVFKTKLFRCPLKRTEASAFRAFSEQVSLQYKNKDVIRFKTVEGQITNALRPVK